MHTTVQQQLTLDVRRHPNIPAGGGILIGSLKLAGEISVDQDLNPGDVVQVVITDADGQPVAAAHAEVTGVGIQPLVDPHVGVIGTERAHKLRVQ